MLYLASLLLVISTCVCGIIIRPPTYTYGVDSIAIELIDYSRQDPYAAAQGIHEPRRLMVSVFFPTGPKADCEASVQKYMPPATAASYDATYDSYGLPRGVFASLELEFCRNNQSSQKYHNTSFPTILFSPGLGNSRLIYSGIAQSLASRGFTVMTIDHPYDAAIVEYPNGSTVLPANITTDKQITFDLDVRVADTSFVLDQLDSHALQYQSSESVTTWNESATPQKYLMYGHSLGGATAVQAMSNDPRLIAAVNLDGEMFGSVLREGVTCPMMLFAHPNHTLATDESWEDVWEHSANATRLELVLNGSVHGTFTDYPLLVDAMNLPKQTRRKLAPLVGTLPGQEVDSTLSLYLDAFFEFALGDTENPVPRRVESSKVTVVKQVKKTSESSSGAKSSIGDDSNGYPAGDHLGGVNGWPRLLPYRRLIGFPLNFSSSAASCINYNPSAWGGRSRRDASHMRENIGPDHTRSPSYDQAPSVRSLISVPGIMASQRTFEIIFNDEPNGAQPPKLTAEARRKVRSHAMRDFKRKQKEARDAANQAALAVSSRSNRVYCINCLSSNGAETGKHDTACNHATLSTDLGHGDFFRYTLVEMFGASLIGHNTTSFRTDAISEYRRYVATTRSNVLRPTDDALCLVLPASTLSDQRILLEARKRHLAGIQRMRKALEADTADPTAMIACATEFLFTALFKPLAAQTEGLYNGVVQLGRTHARHLRDSQTPQAMYLLISLRRMMLLQSLSSATPLPVKVSVWKDLPAMSSLLPEITDNLMQIAMQLPDLLTAAREAQQSRESAAIEQARYDLLALECQLSQWQTEYCTEPFHIIIRPSNLRPRECQSIPEEDRSLKDVGLCPKHPILSIHCQAMRHICLLRLQESLADLSTAKDDSLGYQYYKQRTTQTADALCRLTVHLAQESNGAMGKALSTHAPLHFARLWYDRSNDQQGLAWVAQQEARIQKEVPFFTWEALLPLSLISLCMQG